MAINSNTGYPKCDKCKTNQADISIDNNWYCLDCVTKYNLDSKSKQVKKEKARHAIK